MQSEVAIELFDESAERSLLSGLMWNPLALGETILDREAFYFQRHQFVFDAIQSLTNINAPVDLISMNAELKQMGRLDAVGGSSWLGELSMQEASSQSAKHHCKIIQDFYRKRTYENLGKTIVYKISTGASTLEVAEYLEKSLAGSEAAEAQATWISLKDSLHEALDEVEKASAKGEGSAGLSTGLIALNRKIGGLREGDLVVVAGRPGMGKTSLASKMGLSAAKAGSTVGIVSLEMSKTELVRRQLAMEGENLSVMNLEHGKLSSASWAAIVNTSASMAELNMFICDSASMTIGQLCQKVRTLQRIQGLDLLVIDYLQLIDTGGRHQDRVNAMSEVSRSLKVLAKELEIPIVALSQVNRECEKRLDKRPLLSDLRETGAIEQDADIVVFVYRDGFYDEDSLDRDIAELLVRKNRHGPTGEARVHWDGPSATFQDLIR